MSYETVYSGPNDNVTIRLPAGALDQAFTPEGFEMPISKQVAAKLENMAYGPRRILDARGPITVTVIEDAPSGTRNLRLSA